MKRSIKISGIVTVVLLCLGSFQIQAQDSDTTKTENHSTFKTGDHELLISPTATTMPKGTWYFTSYELILINLGYSITDDFQVGVFSIFPVTSDFLKTVSVGAKYRLYENKNFSVATTGAVLFDPGVYNVAGVTTYRNEKLTLNANFGYSGSTSGGSGGLSAIIGLQYGFSDRFSLIGEYLNLRGADDITESTGLIFAGCRWVSEKMSFDFGGFRPTDDVGDDIILIPYIKGTIIF